MGSKSKSTTVGYHYRMAYHIGLVGRKIDAFLEFRGADKTAWAGELTSSGRFEIDAPDLFGGEKDQGGIVGPVDVMFGEPDQMPNPYLVEVFGNQTAAWRGMTTLAFCGGRFGAMNPYQPKSAYKIRKIKSGWDGAWGDDPCWYPETAEVPLLDGAVSMLGPGWEYQIEHFTEPNTVWDNFEIPVDGWLQGGEMPFTTDGMAGGPYWTPTRSNIWLRRQLQVHGAGLTLNIGADNGCVVWINGLNVGSSNPTNEPIPSNQNNPVSYVLGAAGTLNVVVKAYAEISISNENGNVVSLSFTGAPLVGINPAHALYYIRTDREKGAEPTASINDASLRAAADRLHAEGFGLCQLVYDPQQDTPDSKTERICRIIGGSFERSLVDGQWYLDLARGEYDLESLPVMDDDDILEFRKQPTTLQGAVNSLAVRYFDPVRKETIITPAVRALGLIRTFGEIHETLDFPEIPTGDLALRVAERELRARITPSQAFEIVTRPRLVGLRRNQYFRLQSPKRGIADMVCIVGERDTGTLRSGAIRWKVAQDIYSLPAATYVEVEHGVDVRPPQAAVPIEAARAFEAPYIDVVAALPRAELEALPDDVGYLLGVAARPAHGLDYTMAVRTEGGEFEPVGDGEWCPTATTADVVPVGVEPVVVPLATVRGLDRVPVGSAVLMGDEILRLDDKQMDPPEVTLARGCADTVPWPHAAGARMWFLGEDMAVDVTEYSDGETVEVKFLTNTGSQRLPLNAAPTQAVVITGRQALPYPPSALKVNHQPYPGSGVVLTGPLELSWEHRDRVLQADQLTDQSVPSVGPEPGTSYNVRTYVNDTIEDEQTGISGNEATVLPSRGGSVRIEVESVRGGLVSWQKQIRYLTYSTGTPGADHVTVTIPPQDAALVGFPVFVDLASMPAEFWTSLAYPDGRDIRVVDAQNTDLPFDLVVCSPESRKGSLFVRVDLSDSISTEFRIRYGNPADNSFVPSGAPNGREAVWVDYDCVYTIGDSFIDRAGKCSDLQTFGSVYGLLQTDTSPNLGVHQGIAWDGAHYYAIGTNELKKYTDDFTLLITNPDPVSSVPGTNHCGDGCVVNGVLYVPVEQFTSVVSYSDMHIARFDAGDLSFLSAIDISAQGHEASSICYCPIDGLLYVSSYADGSKLWKYQMDGAFVGVLPLSTTINLIQGITFWRGAFWVNRDDTDRTLRVEYDGTVKGMAWGIAGGSYEGLDHSEDALLLLHDVALHAGVVRRLESRPVAGESGTYLNTAGHYRADGVPRRTTWTIGSTAARLSGGSSMGVVSYTGTGVTNNALRATMAIRNTGHWGIWDSDSGWLNQSSAASVGMSSRLHMIYDNGLDRDFFVDGVSIGPQPTSAVRPAPAGGHSLYIGASQEGGMERFNGYIGLVYLRPDVLPKEWLAAEALNLENPGAFYNVT